jgi:hypothetical protein
MKTMIKTTNYTLKSSINLLQTDLVINTSNVYSFDNEQFYLSTCKKGVVRKCDFDSFGNNVFIYTFFVNPVLKRKLTINN